MQMKARGEDVLSLAIGEPDFPTPEHIVDAAKAALDAGFTKYTPSPGIRELREAIAEKSRKENGIAATPERLLRRARRVSSNSHIATTIAATLNMVAVASSSGESRNWPITSAVNATTNFARPNPRTVSRIPGDPANAAFPRRAQLGVRMTLERRPLHAPGCAMPRLQVQPSIAASPSP